MKESKVVLIRCASYKYEIVLDAVKKGISLLGGIENFVSSGENIVLKPNVLSGDAEGCVSTHPSILRATAEVFNKTKCTLKYGDSPGFGSPEKHLKKGGLIEAAQKADLKLADFTNSRDITFEESPMIKSFPLARGALQADGIISLPKFKTHQLTRITGAVKNQFGCIPGTRKAKYHVSMKDAVTLSKFFVVINLFLRPRLYIMDGVRAMEGNGPGSGKPADMNVIIMSRDPVALDSTVCRMINLKPEYVPTNTHGARWNLGTYDRDEIELVGDDLDDFLTPGFDVVRSPVESSGKKGIVGFFRQWLIAKPVIRNTLCTRCGRCVEICPVDPTAVDWSEDGKKNPPEYDYQHCIRCYCCQEMCPEGAIEVKTPLPARLLRFITERF